MADVRDPATADVYDHVHAEAGDPLKPGVYRVVGTDDDGVTLLRVVEDGSRVHCGVVVHASHADLDALEPADNPDTGLGRLRQVLRNLAASPLLSTGALALLTGGGYLATTATGFREDVGALALAVGAAALWLLSK